MGSGRRALAKADSPTAVALASVAKLFQPSAVDWMPVACDAEPHADARTPEATVATWPRFGPAGRLPPTAVLWSPVAWALWPTAPALSPAELRSEESRVGTEGVS